MVITLNDQYKSMKEGGDDQIECLISLARKFPYRLISPKKVRKQNVFLVPFIPSLFIPFSMFFVSIITLKIVTLSSIRFSQEMNFLLQTCPFVCSQSTANL